MAEDSKKKKRQSNAEKPISLKPLQFDEAVTDLLQVKPEPKEKKLGRSKKKHNNTQGGML